MKKIRMFLFSFLFSFVLSPNLFSQNSSSAVWNDKEDPDDAEDIFYSDKDDPDEVYSGSDFDDFKIDPDDIEETEDSELSDDFESQADEEEIPEEKSGGEKREPDEIEDEEEIEEPTEPLDEEDDKLDPDEFEDEEEIEEPTEPLDDEEDDKLDPDEIEDEEIEEESPEEPLTDEDDKVDPDEEDEEIVEEVEEVTFEPSENTLSFSLGILSIPSDYYNFYTLLDVRYRNYFHNPFYWFCGGAFGSSSPNGDFPYTYQSNGKNIGAPHSYLNYTYGGFGYVYNNKEHEFTVFSELSLGAAFRFLYNNSLKNAHFGKLYPNVIAGLAVGGTWKYARAEIGVNFDSNFQFEFSGSIGVSIPIDVLKSLFTGKKRTESKPVL